MENMSVRFFTYCNDEAGEDVTECTEHQFLSLKGEVTYARHTVWENGVNQICLTVQPFPDYPEKEDVESDFEEWQDKQIRRA